MTGRILTENEFRRNNLDKSSSPYLLQHIDNPVWWQEWSDELIKHAVINKKLLFVSVGYATCHWCHVMASETFSDPNTADYLNSHFVCIKVDREQRPDIDQVLMDFINNQNGRGGWPLNVFMTPGLRPIYALTYAPVHSRDSMHSLQSIAEKVIEFYDENEDNIPPFVPTQNPPGVSNESLLAKTLSKYYDQENGGFGAGPKFPPHSSLLYLLYQLGIEDSPSIKTVVSKTLDNMNMRGLNDHLQGGIFRYCVDREWTIPHFEKMLYDQAMELWCYSLAYRVLHKESYKNMANKILMCLEDCFKQDGFYITALDADTGHEEGMSYLWSYDEIKNDLLPEEFEEFSKSYFIDPSGNFEGLIHLIRIDENPLNEIEDKLLKIRNTWSQPSRDDKVLCGMNSLLAISMLQAGRFLDRPDLEKMASDLMLNVLNKFWDKKTLKHSYYNGSLQKQSYLFDSAATLTAISMLYENDLSWGKLMGEMKTYVESFKDSGQWKESSESDFQSVFASWSDHPVPSSVSLAELGLTRVALLSGENLHFKDFREPFLSDFYNIMAMMNNGMFHSIESARDLSWNDLPVNSIKVYGTRETDCFMGACRPLGENFPLGEPKRFA